MNLEQKSSSHTAYAKACGKVLIVGGYGVLQPQNIGLSLALQTFFYSKASVKKSNSEMKIIIVSQQINKQWTYLYDQKNVIREENNKQNIFVENAVRFTLQYLDQRKSIEIKNCGQIHIQLLFDKGFISDKNIIDEKQVIQKKFLYQKFPNYESQYSKTGLGSSACVLVSIVNALLMLFELEKRIQKNIINAISQVANLAAQKKIGSNFDISTAVYGSHLYKNIIPNKAYECIKNFNKFQDLLKINPQIDHISNHLNQVFKQRTIAFIVDIAKGANTRKMVGNFLKNLKEKDEVIQKQFFSESKLITRNLYQLMIDQKIEYEQLKIKLREINIKHRCLQQKYSIITQTDVQPQGLRGPLDELLKNDQILYAICPGSGGWDAFFVLAQKGQQNSQSVIKNKIQNILKNHKLQSEVKQVRIKWQASLQVTQEQKKQIEEYLFIKNEKNIV